jgi:Holliday junction DNA helicase RuvA
LSTDHLVVETGGVGYLVYAPRPVLSNLGAPGDEVSLQTVLVVREDALTLYGFATAEQRSLFEKLLSVTGVGPRIALALLSAATPDEIRLAVAQNDSARFARVSGIGKKMAERLVLELKGKLDLKNLPTSAPSDQAGQTGAAPAALAVNSDLADLLVSLGYSSTEASAAIAALPPDAPQDLEERLRLALRYFGGA